MNKKTLQTIKEVVKSIKKNVYDDEAAHSMEDYLREMTLASIATGTYSKKECVEFAKEALKTKKIKFSRWCA